MKRGILKTRTSSSGPSVRSSSKVNAVSRTAAPAKQARVPAEAQPHCGPSMMASTNNRIPAVETTTPRMSKGCWRTRGSRGISNSPAISVTITIGTFTKKIDPYQKCSSSAPPTIGPNATAMPDVAPQIPSAFCRSDGSGKTLVRIARLAGKMKAAASAHQCPRGDERAGRVGEGRRRREQAEEDQPDLHRALASQPVPDPAAGE